MTVVDSCRRPVDRARVGQVQAMFPQLDRRSIAWALQRNGGNVQGVVELALQGGGDLERVSRFAMLLDLFAVPTSFQSLARFLHALGMLLSGGCRVLFPPFSSRHQRIAKA
jgi:CUE domain